jgi:hypothetical protein
MIRKTLKLHTSTTIRTKSGIGAAIRALKCFNIVIGKSIGMPSPVRSALGQEGGDYDIYTASTSDIINITEGRPDPFRQEAGG